MDSRAALGVACHGPALVWPVDRHSWCGVLGSTIRSDGVDSGIIFRDVNFEPRMTDGLFAVSFRMSTFR
jgi:hypothetical protein